LQLETLIRNTVLIGQIQIILEKFSFYQSQSSMKKPLLEIIVFVCGALVMVFELVGARILGPYVGTSLFIWTSLIGIILGSLSLGYWLGGKVADKKPDYTIFATIVLLAGLSILFTALIKDPLLNLLSRHIFDIRYLTILASVLLFAPASVFLGMVSPYAVKLKLQSLNQSGRTVGNLYALSTIGSIAGTFGAGFFLIPTFGTNRIVFVIAFSLLAISLLIFLLNKKWLGTISSVFFILLLAAMFWIGSNADAKVIDVDTLYNRVLVYNTTDYKTGKEIKILKINDERSSAVFPDNDELVFDYLKYYHLAAHFNPGFSKALMIGGSAYTYPLDYLKKYPHAIIDVVEIDPQLTELAKIHFGLKEHPRLNIIHEDGRTFLNRNHKKYDVIFMDAFRSQFTVPFQLTTRECIAQQYESLNNGGLVIANIIATLDGISDDYLQAQALTYADVFRQVIFFAVDDPENEKLFQNIMIVALKDATTPEINNPDPELNTFLSHKVQLKIRNGIPVLTDDYAPVEYYANRSMAAYMDLFKN
jgi:spermidine synthase